MAEILIVGNPNTGKSTFFNTLTKANAHTGNFHGVTVNFKKAECKVLNCTFVDLPGLYSMSPNSYEEEVSVNYILSHKKSCIVCLCNNQTLRRNLLLATELIDLGREVVVVVNEIGKKIIVDYNKLQEKLGVKVISLKANNKKTFKNFFSFFETKKEEKNTNENYDKFYQEKVLCGCEYYRKLLNISDKISLNNYEYLEKNIKEKYTKIDEILKYSEYKTDYIVGKSKIDKIILNKYLCLPIFLIILFVIFYLTFFSVGKFFSDILRYIIQDLIGENFVNFLNNQNTPQFVVSLVKDGIFSGVGSVVSFLPQVVILFLFLDILEQSGYISRLAFCLDDALKSVGLSGRSVYTLIMGFGCSTTASLTARNMSDNNAKIKTALLSPYMSCSAKLPVYAVIGGAFFGAQNMLIIVLLYIVGIIVSLLMSLFLERTKLCSKEQTFIMEFPSYQCINIKHILKNTLSTAISFLVRIGSVILSLSVVVWLLQNISFSLTYVKLSGEKSILQVLGEFFAPIFKPLGFASWGAVSSLIAGIVAKEVIVSSIAIFNNVNMSSIGESIILSSSVVHFTPASAISFMVFCLLYCPCISTLVTFKKEIGTKWTIFSVLSQFVVAYIISMFTYTLFRATEVFGFLATSICTVIIVILIYSIVSVFKYRKCNLCNKKCK